MTMAEGHPHEHDLLAFVEDELSRDERDAVRRHLDACAACRTQVADVEAGRAVLRAAPQLELDPGRRDAILAGLGEPQRRRRPSWGLVAVSAAALAIAAGLAVISLSGNGSDDSAREGASATQSADEQTEGGAAAPTAPGQTLLGEVAGTPASVAQALRDDGFDATVVDGTVVVEVGNARRDELERAVAALDPGPVPVYVK